MLLITKRSERVKRNLKKYKKTKFNYENFISEYYIDDDGKAYISAKVSSLYDIISKHSIEDYEWVNPTFIEYIENMAYYIPVEEAIVIEICGHKFNEKEQKLIKRVLTQYFGLKLGDAIIDINIMKRKSYTLLIFGFISILLFMLLNIINVIPTISEIIAIGLWFFLWEYLDLIFLNGSDLATKKLEAAQLANVKIIFNEKEK